jgi:hypothetical protein
MSTSFSDLVAQVVDITDRGESTAMIQLAIAKATLKAHLADFWLKDVVEVKIPPGEIQGQRLQIFLSDKIFDGFRAVSYINGYDDVSDPSNPRVMQQFTENAPSEIYNIYGGRKINVYYLAGDIITLWAGVVPPKFLIGFWKLPQVQAANYKSWIADIFPPIIVDEACGEVFGSVGDDDEAKRRRDMFVSNLQFVRINSVLATGR